jgi:hypothetical protein
LVPVSLKKIIIVKKTCARQEGSVPEKREEKSKEYQKPDRKPKPDMD